MCRGTRPGSDQPCLEVLGEWHEGEWFLDPRLDGGARRPHSFRVLTSIRCEACGWEAGQRGGQALPIGLFRVGDSDQTLLVRSLVASLTLQGVAVTDAQAVVTVGHLFGEAPVAPPTLDPEIAFAATAAA